MRPRRPRLAEFRDGSGEELAALAVVHHQDRRKTIEHHRRCTDRSPRLEPRVPLAAETGRLRDLFLCDPPADPLRAPQHDAEPSHIRSNPLATLPEN